MRAGRLRHRLLIDEPQVSQDYSGDEIVTWTPYAEVYADIQPVTGREAFRADQILAEMDTRITVRWSSHIDRVTAKWRLRFKNEIYNIVSVAHKGMRNREVEFLCKSGLNDG